MADLAFTQNFTHLFEIDVTPDGASRTWARIGAGINSVSWEGNEEVAQDPYYDGDGMAESEVTGGQLVGTFEGNRCYGDPAQDFIASLLMIYGEGRKTSARWTQPNGDVLYGDVTIANISPQGGDPNAKSDFSFELHFNGMPDFTVGDADTFPTAVEVEAVTVTVGESVSAEAAVTPEGASPALVYIVEDDSIATVSSDGMVSGVAQGSTNLMVKSAVKPSIRSTVTVTVSPSS